MPGRAAGPNLEDWFPLLRFGLPQPPALAHRLDRDTSGCLVLGRHPKALRRLGPAVRRRAGRENLLGRRRRRAARSRGPHRGRARKADARHVGWRMVVDPAGQRAVTDYRVLGAATGAPGSNCGRAPGAPIRSACIAPRSAARWSATRPMAGRPSDEPLQLHARAISLPLYPAKPPIAVDGAGAAAYASPR